MIDYLKSLYYWGGKVRKDHKEDPAAPTSKRASEKKGASKEGSSKRLKQAASEPSTPLPTEAGSKGSKGHNEGKGTWKSRTEDQGRAADGKSKKRSEMSRSFKASVEWGWLYICTIIVVKVLSEVLWPSSRHEQVITFQEFRTHWLAEKRVSQIHVINFLWARVHEAVWAEDSLPEGAEGPLPKPSDVFRCKFALGSLGVFERSLEEAQRELGYAPEDFVPVKFMSLESTWSWTMGHLYMSFLFAVLLFLGIRLWQQTIHLLGVLKLIKAPAGRPQHQASYSASKQASVSGGKGGLLGLLGAILGMAMPHELDKDEGQTRFKDVAGCDEAKEEIMEFVEFLKNPKRYQDIGAKIPRGALLVGPPGTGKTLLAKAAAGEASVPFLGMNGSEFCDMFAGVGSAKVRDLFSQARDRAPCIIFIDEIDAIGRARGRRAMGADADRESTLNQLLVEMDGFASTDDVVVLGSTNRADILDKALLRPGRFSRQISVDAPDVKGREQIFRVYLAKLKLAKEMDFYPGRLAALTPGMTGADISNVCNEAALFAARLDLDRIDLPQFEAAIDRVIGGLEKKHKVISKEERRVVATHESGHAVVSWFLEHAEPLLKVSIVPRGSSTLGFAQYLPNENLLMNKEQLLDNMKGALGGRAAEQVILGKISTGAVNDLEKVTQMAYAQVAVYGMNDKVGLLSYRLDQEAYDKPYSNETAHLVDTEARLLVSEAYASTVALVEEKRDFIHAMADMLLEREVIGLDELEGLLGPRPFASTGELRNIDRYRKQSSKSKDGIDGKGVQGKRKSKKHAGQKHFRSDI